ncbi:MAG: hypothetical protein WAK11_09370, partial [Candidatus Cybelea sp.]
MSGSLRSVVALVLIASAPAAALAQSHPSSHVSSGGGHPSSGSGRVSTQPAPAAPPAQSHHGFSFPNESNVRPIPQPRPVAPSRPVAQPVSNGTGANRAPANYVHSPVNRNVTGGPYRGQFHGRVIYNPRRWGGWGWNRGIHWY